MGLFNNKKEENKTQELQWYEAIIEENKNNTKKLFDFGCNMYIGTIIILTNDNKIICASRKNGSETECKTANIEDILKVEMMVQSKVKSQRQWWNPLLFTMEEVSRIEYVELKIITFDEVYRFKIYNGSNFQNKLDYLEILQAYLERKVKNNDF